MNYPEGLSLSEYIRPTVLEITLVCCIGIREFWYEVAASHKGVSNEINYTIYHC